MRTELTIRVSALPGYPECPRRSAALLFRSLIEAAGYKLRELPHGIGAAVGTSFHRAAEVMFREKATSGTLPPLSLATDCAVETLQEQIKEGIDFDGPRGMTQNASIAEAQLVRMSGAYHREIAPGVEPLIVEERLDCEFSPGIVISGQPDLVAREPMQIRDLKSSARPGRNYNPQIGAYSLIARAHGYPIERAAIDTVRRVRGATPQPSPTTTTVPLDVAEQAAANILRHIEADLHVFHNGDERMRLLPGDPAAFIANPNTFLCSSKYCPAHSCGANGWCQEWRTTDDC